jgi:hypothetical protein
MAESLEHNRFKSNRQDHAKNQGWIMFGKNPS